MRQDLQNHAETDVLSELPILMMQEWCWYKRKRWQVLSRICGSHVPMCERCGKVLYVDVDILHIHHVNDEEGHASGIGGAQHLLKVIEDLKDGVEMEVNCHSCHAWKHDRALWSPLLEVPV